MRFRFIRRVFRWIRSRWMLRRLKGAVRLALRWDASVFRLRLRTDYNIKLMTELRERLELLHRDLDDAVERHELDLDERKRLDKEHEVVVDSLQTELRGYKEVTLPFLVAQDELKLARIKAEITVLSAKQALNVRQEDIGG